MRNVLLVDGTILEEGMKLQLIEDMYGRNWYFRKDEIVTIALIEISPIVDTGWGCDDGLIVSFQDSTKRDKSDYIRKEQFAKYFKPATINWKKKLGGIK